MKRIVIVTGAVFAVMAAWILPPGMFRSDEPTPSAPPASTTPTSGVAKKPAGPKHTVRTPVFDDSLEARTARNAPGTAQAVLAIPNEELRKKSLLRVMQAWASADARGALAWAKDAPFASDYERHVASSMACTTLAGSDPEKALCLAIDDNLDPEDFGLLEGLTDAWWKKDPEAACTWVLRQPAGPMREHLVESMALEMFDLDEAAASRFVQQQIPAGESQRGAMLSLLSQLALRNPEAARQWAAQFPEGEFRNQALSRVAGIQNGREMSLSGDSLDR